jgi:FkbM family methyltransferase
VISYAQNQEDVVLQRLTRFVEKGAYVDVGAAHPVIHNVTYSLYLAGWRGVNIEPMEREARMLREQRPEDVTFQVAAGSLPGSLTLYVAPMENRGATTSDVATVERYVFQGQVFETTEVEVSRVDSMVAATGLTEVHVLKIDVEGAEKSVLEGCNLGKMRPWVIVIEATRPNSPEDASSEWQPMILEQGYVLTLFDGLNKYFVRDDLPHITEVMSVPANVFDDWTSHELVKTRAVLDQTSEDAKRFVESLTEHVKVVTERAETAEKYSTRLEGLLYKAMGWLPERARPTLD